MSESDSVLCSTRNTSSVIVRQKYIVTMKRICKNPKEHKCIKGKTHLGVRVSVCVRTRAKVVVFHHVAL